MDLAPSIEEKLPWLTTKADQPADVALKAAGIRIAKVGEVQPGDARLVFER